MRKLLISASIAGAALLLLVLPAAAARTWCRADPTFSVDGNEYQVDVSSYSEITTSTTGPIKLILTVPIGSNARLIHADNGFGKGWDISISYSNTPKGQKITAAVFVPASDGTLPVQVDVTSLSLPQGNPLSTGKGQVNTWVTAKAK